MVRPIFLLYRNGTSSSELLAVCLLYTSLSKIFSCKLIKNKSEPRNRLRLIFALFIDWSGSHFPRVFQLESQKEMCIRDSRRRYLRNALRWIKRPTPDIFYFFNHCFCDWFKINWLEGERTLFGLLKDRWVKFKKRQNQMRCSVSK